MKQNVEVGAIEFCEAEMNVICPDCNIAFRFQWEWDMAKEQYAQNASQNTR